MLVCLLLLGGTPLQADWQSEVARLLGQRLDHRGTVAYLTSRMAQIDPAYRPTVLALLSYCAHQLHDQEREYAWIVEYYEKHRGMSRYLGFLDETTIARVSAYLRRWDTTYPLITEIGLIKTPALDSPSPPSDLLVGLEVENDAFYKLTGPQGPLEGGLFKKGFNAVRLPAAGFWDTPGTHSYGLDLKAGDFVLHKEIAVDIGLKTAKAPKLVEAKTPDITYRLSLYYGDRLVTSSQKLAPLKPSLELGIKPTPGRKFEPFGPKKEDPAMNQVSIFQALALAGELLKSLTSGKREGSPAQPLQTHTQVEVNFLKKSPEGQTVEVQAAVRLRLI